MDVFEADEQADECELMPAALSERIRERAYALGFDLVRITSAAPLPRAEAALKTRIAAGFFEGMDWLTPERAEVSSDPRALLPTARSTMRPVSQKTMLFSSPGGASAHTKAASASSSRRMTSW